MTTTPLPQRLLGWLLRRDGYVTEVQNSLMSLIVGTVFVAGRLAGVDIYTRRAEIYQHIAWVPQAFWGVLFLLGGTVHLISLWQNRRWLRKYILLIKAALWVNLGLSIVMADPFALVGWIFIHFGVFAVRSFLRIQIIDPAGDHRSTPPDHTN